MLAGTASLPDQAELDEVEEVVNLKKFEESDKNTHAQGGNTGDDDEEEDDDEHGQRVGCQAQ